MLDSGLFYFSENTVFNFRLVLGNQDQLSSQFFILLRVWTPLVGYHCGPYIPLFLSGGPSSWWLALHLVMNSVLTNRKALNLLPFFLLP